jgi:hypothetical protein
LVEEYRDADSYGEQRLMAPKIVEFVPSLLSEIDRLTAERDAAEASDEAAHQKLDVLVRSLRPGAEVPTCGCSYDRKSDVCLHHSPQLVEAKAIITRLRHELTTAREALRNLANGVPDPEGDITKFEHIRSGEKEV